MKIKQFTHILVYIDFCLISSLVCCYLFVMLHSSKRYHRNVSHWISLNWILIFYDIVCVLSVIGVDRDPNNMGLGSFIHSHKLLSNSHEKQVKRSAYSTFNLLSTRRMNNTAQNMNLFGLICDQVHIGSKGNESKGLNPHRYYDFLTQDDIVRKQYSLLPFPPVSKHDLAIENMYYSKRKIGNNLVKPFTAVTAFTLESLNHFLFAGRNNFRQNSFLCNQIL